MKKLQVTYKGGEAFVVTSQTQAIVRCKETAELALEGGIRPNKVDMAALAAGYLALLARTPSNDNAQGAGGGFIAGGSPGAAG
jgi:hypothetical protein